MQVRHQEPEYNAKKLALLSSRSRPYWGNIIILTKITTQFFLYYWTVCYQTYVGASAWASVLQKPWIAIFEDKSEDMNVWLEVKSEDMNVWLAIFEVKSEGLNPPWLLGLLSLGSRVRVTILIECLRVWILNECLACYLRGQEWWFQSSLNVWPPHSFKTAELIASS